MARAVPGVRVVLDLRPLQTPEHAPLTATYLAGLLRAFDADPLAGESFALFLRSDLDDPTGRYGNLEIVGRRLLPPTRLLRSAAMTVDPFLLRGATVGAAWRAERGGAAGAVYHAVGGGSLPIAPDLPVVVTLLDLAPWEMPESFQQSIAGRFGQRLRAQQLRDAAAVIVGSEATARAARRLLHVEDDRLRIVHSQLDPRSLARVRADPDRRRSSCATGLVWPSATWCSPGATTLGRISPPCSRPLRRWPPRAARRDLVRRSRGHRASCSLGQVRRIAPHWLARPPREGIGESLAYAPALASDALAGLVRAARAVILPVLSEASGLPIIEAIACGTPVVASAVGPLPELIGPAGLLVEPRDPDRLAVALATIWADDSVHQRIATAARGRAKAERRSWADVASDTRTVYARVGIKRGPADGE